MKLQCITIPHIIHMIWRILKQDSIVIYRPFFLIIEDFLHVKWILQNLAVISQMTLVTKVKGSMS